MKYTQNLNMKIPEGGDPIDIVDITENFETLDIEINKKANTSGGDISDTTIKTVDAIATEFPVPSAGESSKTFLGKVRKFIQDFIAIKDTLLTLSKLVNNGQTTASGFALDARYGKTLADQVTKLNTDLTNFQSDFRTAKPLPDDTDINALIAPGTYNIYTTIDGKKYRWIVVVDWCNAGGVSLSRQTAFYYLGSGAVAPLTRYQYNTGSNYTWSQWYYGDPNSMKITNITSGEINHTISFGYFSQGGKVYINVYVDGAVYGQIQPIP